MKSATHAAIRRPRVVLFGATFVAFSLFTLWVVWTAGYTTVFTDAWSRTGSMQVFVDLSLACSLIWFPTSPGG
jgi:hypothetical protein